LKRKEREKKWSARAHRRRRRRRKRDERIGLFAAAKEEGKKEKKIDPSVGRSSVGRRRLRGVDFAFENTERTHLNLHPFCICGYYILKFLCENSRAVVVERVFPAARAKKE